MVSPRALDAVKFQLSDGKSADILANWSKVSSRGRPRSCSNSFGLSFPSRAADRPDPDRFQRFLAGHPAGRASSSADEEAVPASYAQTIYHAEHAFSLQPPWSGTSRFRRYRFVPHAGEAFLSPDDPASEARAFCARSWKAVCGPAGGRSGSSCVGRGRDPTDDVTALWPEGRPWSSWGSGSHRHLPTSAADERPDLRPTNRTTVSISGRSDSVSPVGRYSISYDRRSKGE